MMKVMAALVVALVASGATQAAPRMEAAREEPKIVGMTRAEVNDLARRTMPLPILRVLSWKEMGLRKWVVEMSTVPLVAPKQPAVHVTFQTEDERGRPEITEAFTLAGEYAKELMVQVASK